ncbi:neuralized-like protein 4 [Ischnura elegans]|uniref:neuralized-like protein 4 n=1 Tax=Ischnura elegans TaxID=197161 RepID=UPI001ED8A4DD|nr:neuralized-like protein 4 [Ischnura elegans]
MNSFPLLPIAIMVTFPLLLTAVSAGDQCATASESGRYFTLSVDRKLDAATGDWIRSFTAQNTDSEKPSDDIVLHATHSNVQCGGRNVVRLEVVVRELKTNMSSMEKWTSLLKFHRRHGKNVVLLEDGRTAQKLDPDDSLNAVTFTNRPLRNDEMFEVRLEKKIKKTNHVLGIGVVTYSPEDVEILPEMHRRNETWIMHHANLYGNNKNLKSNIGKNLDTLEVNDRVGVMRRTNGELHFFINGVDQGSAAVVPEGVYGIMEVWHDANRVRIVY